MKIFLAPLLALTACAGGIPQPAQHSAVDEEARKRCEQTYKLSRTVMEMGVDAGLIRGARAVTVAALDTQLYGALNVCRTAYRLVNSAELIRAADEMDAKSNEAVAVASQKGPE